MKKECLILGGLVPDVYYSVSRWPDRGQDGFISDENVVVGGCAVNMAVTAEIWACELTWSPVWERMRSAAEWTAT